MLTLNRTAKVKVNKIKALRAFLTYKLRFSTDPFLTIQPGFATDPKKWFLFALSHDRGVGAERTPSRSRIK